VRTMACCSHGRRFLACGSQAFMGPAGIHSKLHVDIWHTDAWLCNLQGRKRFSVFHPAYVFPFASPAFSLDRTSVGCRVSVCYVGCRWGDRHE
jgi:hypothetical protein